MKQVIYKYPFSIQDEVRLELPLGAQILFIEKQKQSEWFDGGPGMSSHVVTEKPCLWAQVDPDQERKEFRHFRIVGTGHEFNSKGMHYIGSLMMANDQLLWHVHEIVVPGAL